MIQSVFRTGLWVAGMAWVLCQPASARADYEKDIKPFFQAHCFACHGEEKPKGDFRLDTLPLDLANPKTATHWTDVMDRINAGMMPPTGRPRPPAKDVAHVAEWIAARFAETEAARLARRERVTFHRLSREEYA